MKTVGTEQIKERLESGPVALIDVRGDVEFEQGHIPGAKTAPLGALGFRVASLMNPDSYVVVYSNGKGCGLAAEAAERLENLGLQNVHCYEEGLEGWRSAGLPVVASVQAKTVTQGPFVECRSIVVDRDRAYGGAFRGEPAEVAGAGG